MLHGRLPPGSPTTLQRSGDPGGDSTLPGHPASPALSQLSVHLQPVSLDPPAISRDKAGHVSIASTGEIRYTLDGTEPDERSAVFMTSVPLARGGTVKSKTYYRGQSSETAVAHYTHSGGQWTALSSSSHEGHNAPWKGLDEDATTDWHTRIGDDTREIVIGLGEEMAIEGFTMLPRQDGTREGIVTAYQLFTSVDGEHWELASSGEFSNVYNNPIEQRVLFDRRVARYIKFRAAETVGERFAAVSELGVIFAEPSATGP